MLFTENETNVAAPVRTRRTRSRTSRTRSTSIVVDGRQRCGESGAHRHPRPRRTTRFRSAPAKRSTVRLRLRAGEPLAQPFGAAFDAMFAHAAGGGRRVLPAHHAVRHPGGHAQRPAPGVRRHAVEQAVLPLHGRALARGRPGRAAAAGVALEGPQPRLVAHVGGRRAVDARQVGVPVVRGVGHGVPHDPVRDDRPRLREGAAHPAHARVVHASERADPGVRVGVLRRQSAGARVGGDARLPDRGEVLRPHRPRVSRARLPEAPHQLHVVGEPQGRRGQQHLRGRLPGPRQHQRVRPHVAACPRAGISSRPTARAGWRCTASTSWASRSSSPRRTRSTRTSRPSSSSTSSTSAPRSTAWASETGGLWNDEDGYYYDVLRLPDGRCYPDPAKTISGLIPIFAVAVADREAIGGFGDFAKRLRWFAKYRPELLHGLGDMTRRGVAGPACASRSSTPTSSTRILAPVLDPEGAAEPARRALGVQVPPRASVSSSRSATTTFTLDYAPGESTDVAVRRQLELARAGVVPAQLPPDRGAAEARRRAGRDVQGRVPDRLGARDDAVGGDHRDDAPPHHAVHARCRRPPARSTATARSSRAIRTGATSSRSTSTSTATPARDSAPATRPAGPASWPSSSTSTRSTRMQGHAGLGDESGSARGTDTK